MAYITLINLFIISFLLVIGSGCNADKKKLPVDNCKTELYAADQIISDYHARKISLNVMDNTNVSEQIEKMFLSNKYDQEILNKIGKPTIITKDGKKLYHYISMKDKTNHIFIVSESNSVSYTRISVEDIGYHGIRTSLSINERMIGSSQKCKWVRAISRKISRALRGD